MTSTQQMYADRYGVASDGCGLWAEIEVTS
jgi:hypothetical protein